MRALDGAVLLFQGAIGAGHLWVGASGFVVHRQRTPAAAMFALALVSLAWATFCTALAGVAWREWPASLALSMLFSGYGAPAMLIFVRRAVYPQRPKLRWPLVLGGFGTAFSLNALVVDPGVLGFLAGFRAGSGPGWHPVASPLYLGHAVEMGACLLWAVGLLVRAAWCGADPSLTRLTRWLLFALGIGIAGVFTFSVLPGALRMGQLTAVAPLATVPTVVLGARALQEIARRERQGWTPRAAAEQARVDSVVDAIRGVTAAVQAALGEIRTAAALVAVPGEAPPAVVARGQAILGRAAEAAGLLERLQRFAVGDAGGRAAGPLDLVGLLSHALPAAAAGAARVDTPGAPVWVLADAESLGRALRALVQNAIEATPGEPAPGAVGVDVDLLEAAVLPPDAVGAALDGAPAVRVRVTDRGPGMAPPVRARAMDPFFSTRPGQAGLGLVDVVAAVRAAHGAFALDSGPSGTCATLWLRPAAAPAAGRVDVGGAAVGVGVLLVVDRDPARRELLERLLRRRGGAALGAGGIAEAMAALDAAGPGAAVDLLWVVHGSERGPGEALARRVAQGGGAVTALVGAGDADPRLPPGAAVLRQPVGPAELVPLLLSRRGAAAGRA